MFPLMNRSESKIFSMKTLIAYCITSKIPVHWPPNPMHYVICANCLLGVKQNTYKLIYAKNWNLLKSCPSWHIKEIAVEVAIIIVAHHYIRAKMMFFLWVTFSCRPYSPTINFLLHSITLFTFRNIEVRKYPHPIKKNDLYSWNK